MKKLNQADVRSAYQSANRRIFLIDYDGTLGERPLLADEPDVSQMLQILSSDTRNSVVVLSDRSPLELNHFPMDAPITIAAERGGFLKVPQGPWQLRGEPYLSWKEAISTALRRLAARYPKTNVDEKQFSISWDYGPAIGSLPDSDQRQLKAAFRILSGQFQVVMTETEHMVVFRDANISKSKFVAWWMGQHAPSDFILAAGDEGADEEVFELIDDGHFAVRIGFEPGSKAAYYLSTRRELLLLLRSLLPVQAISNPVTD